MNNERGFSLPEVLIASVLLTVGLLGMAELLVVGLRTHQLAQGSTEATRLAEAKVEELMKANFQTAPEIQLTLANSLDHNVSNYFDVPLPGYIRRWQVEAGPAGNAGLRLVTVRVVPVVADRRNTRDIRLATLIRSW